MVDLEITYDLSTDDSFNCWCSRWDTSNYQITLELILDKTRLNYLRNNTNPGSYYLNNIIGTHPIIWDLTPNDENTLKISPIAGNKLNNSRDEIIVFVKNISDSPYEGMNGMLLTKIEAYISGANI